MWVSRGKMDLVVGPYEGKKSMQSAQRLPGEIKAKIYAILQSVWQCRSWGIVRGGIRFLKTGCSVFWSLNPYIIWKLVFKPKFPGTNGKKLKNRLETAFSYNTESGYVKKPPHPYSQLHKARTSSAVLLTQRDRAPRELHLSLTHLSNFPLGQWTVTTAALLDNRNFLLWWLQNVGPRCAVM